MKKYVVLLGLLGIVPAFAGEGYTTRYASSCKTCGAGTVRSGQNGAYKTTSGATSRYNNTITNNFYYTQPVGGTPRNYARSGETPRNYYTPNRARSEDYREYVEPQRKSYEKTSYSSQTRKFFLAHPFFQPTEGKFGSVTDLSYATNNFTFDVLNASVVDIDAASTTYGQTIAMGTVMLKGKQETTQIAVKEDFSYGITDTLSLLGMVQYDRTEVSLKDWSDGTPGDTLKDSGVNIFGLGLQYRFVDDNKWIAMAEASFQHQKDTANTLILDVKAGYKIHKSTLYGLGRVGYSDLTKGDIYGAYVSDKTGDWLMLSYETDVDSVVYVEGGIGIFSVINKYMTLNGELIYGSYDWHNQLSLKGAVGFQPADTFALNLYAMTALYDSADGKVLKYMNYDRNPDTTNFPAAAQGTTLVYTTGDYKIKEYSEWKIGIQGILYF